MIVLIVCPSDVEVTDEGYTYYSGPVCKPIINGYTDLSNAQAVSTNMHIYAIDIDAENVPALQAMSNVHILDEGRLANDDFGQFTSYLASNGINKAKFNNQVAHMRLDLLEKNMRRFGLERLGRGIRGAVVKVGAQLP